MGTSTAASSDKWKSGKGVGTRRKLPLVVAFRLRGVTLVELLVVLAISGLLIALLMPAIQVAREAARRAQCRNHLRQLGMAFLSHEQAQEFLPSGGWAQRGFSWAWGGVPGHGFRLRQPGGWGYTTLPYVEQQALLILAREPPVQATCRQVGRRISSALPVHYCPSRRRVQLYPNTKVRLKPYVHYGSTRPTFVAKNDYAANLGDREKSWPGGKAPWTLAEADAPGRFGWREVVSQSREWHSGVSFSYSCLELREITDGLSRTYMIGEKQLNPLMYENGVSDGDDGTVYACHNSDTHRSTHPSFPPRKDGDPAGDIDYYGSFGSAHVGSFHMAMCDGSVGSISYSIDANVHRALGTRAGGEISQPPP